MIAIVRVICAVDDSDKRHFRGKSWCVIYPMRRLDDRP